MITSFICRHLLPKFQDIKFFLRGCRLTAFWIFRKLCLVLGIVSGILLCGVVGRHLPLLSNFYHSLISSQNYPIIAQFTVGTVVAAISFLLYMIYLSLVGIGRTIKEE